MPFFLPKGAYVYNRMVDYVRDALRVGTATKRSSRRRRSTRALPHERPPRPLQREHVPPLDGGPARGACPAEKLEGGAAGRARSALKPMNCPSHCVIFGSASGATASSPGAWRTSAASTATSAAASFTGSRACGRSARTTRTSSARRSRSPARSTGFLRFFYGVYRAFNFEKIDDQARDPRPEKRFGDGRPSGTWREARARGGPEEGGARRTRCSPGEGAFYGPKIEFHVQDALKRSWQLGTIQYDPNLPERFDLAYVGEDGKEHRPMMLHRAIFGSLERFFAVYLEHCGGNFPAWISPRQAILLTVSDKVDDYAARRPQALRRKGLRVDVDDSADKLGRQDPQRAARAATRTCCVVGPKEAETATRRRALARRGRARRDDGRGIHGYAPRESSAPAPRRAPDGLAPPTT